MLSIPLYLLIVFSILISYLLGSIPFGFVLAKLFKVDIQKVGSGNIGATNVFRTLGPTAGVTVFILDLLKGTLATYIAILMLNDPLWIVISGFAAIVGHMFPVFLKFKGGRGSATGLGVLLGIAPEAFIGAMFLVALIIIITRYVSLASISVSPLVAIYMFAADKPLPYSIAAAIAALLIILKHIPNIKRLIKGTERKIGEKTNV
ncbi:MAG: glycerol-3-phosphate 1-O-acyltransferase PlsY [Candidatus Margulisbacteria bacterium]|nr:glycerol-3-phosphate 1-O-acyltransferase PlsY [Candidatus Margulisiibacteriota bacterium]MBU1022051.1 glycerol-3-phosphate 1-O-acyltransferase PlsY [Candidatus Margulisiibacteriota bacterium]MBU1729646.1 glycerol-3-phosphate 1-O-acyltransferase PlsY [Candidatus Margulisiibacteriota bacterium]MBU1954966.1 glycerol-3-phosphate 1-O-acyltransferase PlsY [Candidatus Margulisiibacteriota bacterium]